MVRRTRRLGAPTGSIGASPDQRVRVSTQPSRHTRGPSEALVDCARRRAARDRPRPWPAGVHRHPQSRRPGPSRALSDGSRHRRPIATSRSSLSTTARPTGRPSSPRRSRSPFPIRVIRNQTNRSFSEANGQAVAIARGELICFLNNDVDPITDEWLGYMVETLDAREAVAVGARLIYPRHRGGARAGSDHADLSLQHAGVAFDRASAVPLARGHRSRRRPGRAVGRTGRGSAGVDGCVPAGSAGRVPRGRRLLPRVRLRHRGCRPVPQAPGGRRPARVRRPRRVVASRVGDPSRRSGQLPGPDGGQPRRVHRHLGAAHLP